MQGAADDNDDVDKRQKLIECDPDRVQRLDSILIPTLIEIYTNTVNLTVRRRAIHVLVKLVYFTRDSVLKTVLKVSLNLCDASHSGNVILFIS